MHLEIVTVQWGDDRYAELIAPLRDDQVLVEQMWGDAEHRFEEHPAKRWVFAVVDGEPAAWAAATWTADSNGRPLLRCSDNYERRGPGRDYRLYQLAYRRRQTSIVVPAARVGVPAVTYLFEQPIALHEADGWVKTGSTGVSGEAGEKHQWWQLRRPADNTAS